MSHQQPYGQQPEYPQQPYGQQQPGQQPAPPTAPRKSWPRRHKGWTAAIVVALLAIGGGIAGGGSSTSTSSPAADAPQGGARPAAPAKPKTWHAIARLSGNGNKRGTVFTIGDGRVRMRYTVSPGADQGQVAIYVMREGKVRDTDGGIPEVMPDHSDSTELAKRPGNYYLDVLAYSATWSVTVEQLR